jgi:hypothetical protein
MGLWSPVVSSRRNMPLSWSANRSAGTFLEDYGAEAEFVAGIEDRTARDFN